MPVSCGAVTYQRLAIDRPALPGSLFVNWYLSHGQPVPNAIVSLALQNFDTTIGWTGIERDLARYHATNVLIYRPASRLWQLQAIESAGLFAIALLLGQQQFG